MTSIDMASFDRQRKIVEREVREEAELIVRKLYLLLFAWLVKATPVRTGRARNGWDGSVGDPSDFVPAEGAASYPPPQPPLSEAQRFRLGMILWIVNNVNYIVYLDEGSSSQAPAGMTAIAIANLRAQLG